MGGSCGLRMGRWLGIVEARNATAEQLAIDEVNVGVYRFDAGLAVGGAGASGGAEAVSATRPT